MFSLNNLKNQMPTETASTLFSAYASFATVMMVARSVAKELIPAPFRSYIYSALSYLFNPLFSRELTLVIDENSGMTRNQVYDAAVVYLRTKIGPHTERLRVGKAPRKKTITVAIDKDEELTDTYENVKLKWSFLTKTKTFGKNDIQEKHYFELKFNKKHKDKVMNFYLPFVLARADAMKAEEKVVKLYTRHIWCRGGGEWGSVNLEHPSTFETMAMDSEMKKMIVEDLERFVGRKEFYKKVGKAWKRGYLLYGPPGTGKSSLIAAMANFLKFDVYDLELTSIYSDSQLKRVLLSTTNRSILVLEDIDCCTVDVRNRGSDLGSDSDSDDSKVTLSGLLNFIDGLWSSCGDERIIVFTTNHKDRLDPALLRPGRMDVHIHMSYCTTSGFKILASNYLGIQDNNRHPLCEEIEGLIESKKATPAEVAEELMKSDDADVALQGLVNMLKCKKVEEEEKTAPIKKQRGIKQIASKLKLHLPWIKS